MKYELIRSFVASELAHRIGAQLLGPDLAVSSVAAISDEATAALTYWQSDALRPDGLPKSISVIVKEKALQEFSKQNCLIVCRNPRLEFIRLLRWFGEEKWLVPDPQGEIHPSARVHSTAVIDSGASIGAGCQIGPRTHITSSCRLGEKVKVGAGCVIGQSGFGYERDEDGIPISFPHLGSVIIENECEIGANTTIARGNLDDTRIGKYVKIDDQVYIAHNCVIGESTLIAGGARICGGVVIGKLCWIGSGAMIRQGLEVGDRAVIGLGAVVVSTIAGETVVAGNPAKALVQE